MISDQGLPLIAVRVLDLTRGLAPGYGSMILADLGAEIVKIEAANMRSRSQRSDTPVGVGLWGAELDRNKLTCTMNLKMDRGIDLFKRLVGIADIVLSGYTPRVMKQFGLEYDVLRQLNPTIVMVNEPGFGSWGPYRDYVAVGGLLDALSGLASVNGYPGGPPIKLPGAYPDPTSGINFALAALMGLYGRWTRGPGQRVDSPMVGAMLPLNGEAIIDEVLNHRTAVPMGNDRYPYAPNGAYKCMGDDRWVAISVKSNAQWEAFCSVIGRPDLLTDPRFSHQEERWQNRRFLDDIVTAYTKDMEAPNVVEELQAKGIETAVVNKAGDVLASHPLNERGFFQFVEMEEFGQTPFTLLPWLMDGQRMKVRTLPPTWGQHNDYVFRELLGLSDTEVEELVQEKVIAYAEPETT